MTCAAGYFCGEHTRNALSAAPSQTALEQSKRFGHRNCINTPYPLLRRTGHNGEDNAIGIHFMILETALSPGWPSAAPNRHIRRGARHERTPLNSVPGDVARQPRRARSTSGAHPPTPRQDDATLEMKPEGPDVSDDHALGHLMPGEALGHCNCDSRRCMWASMTPGTHPMVVRLT